MSRRRSSDGSSPPPPLAEAAALHAEAALPPSHSLLSPWGKHHSIVIAPRPPGQAIPRAIFPLGAPTCHKRHSKSHTRRTPGTLSSGLASGPSQSPNIPSPQLSRGTFHELQRRSLIRSQQWLPNRSRPKVRRSALRAASTMHASITQIQNMAYAWTTQIQNKKSA